MRRILNFIITGVILWVAAFFFPSCVQIENFGILALATLLIWVIQVVVVVVCLLVMCFGAIVESAAWIVLSVVAMFFSEAIALSVLSANLDGFAVNGFWPKVILSICCTLLTISAPKKNQN